MTTKLQVVFDCANPGDLSWFWAEVLHYKLQDPPKGFDSWEAFLGAMGIPEEEWHSASAIVDPEGVGPRIYFQRMTTPKLGKNRLHLDVNVGGGPGVPLETRRQRVEEEVIRLLDLGAKERETFEENGEYWTVMLDPEGNEFCLQ